MAIKVFIGQIWVGRNSFNSLLKMRVAEIGKGKGDSREIQVETIVDANGKEYEPPYSKMYAVVEWLPRIAKPEKEAK